jgi:type I restriction enzyme, S subunit
VSVDLEKGEWGDAVLPLSWCWVDFDDFWADYTDATRKLPQKDYLTEGALTVIDQGAGLIGGYTNDVSKKSLAPLPAIIFGDHTRAVKYVDFPFVQGADGVRVLCAASGIEPSFAYHALRCVKLPDKGYSRHFKFLKATSFPFAPPFEQRRIVAKIDSLSAKSKRARDCLDHIPRLVEKYKQAILAAAFRGELTQTWRKDHPTNERGHELRSRLLRKKEWKQKPDFSHEHELECLPASWTWMPVEAIALKVVDGVHKKPVYVEDGIPFLTVKNMTAGSGISFAGCKFITPSDHAEFIKRTLPERGDILITKDGTLGVTRAIRTDTVFSIFVSLALVKLIDKEMSDYLELAFQSPQVQRQMVGVGSGLQHIHLTDLKRDLIPMAPVQERPEIVRRVQTAFSWIDRLAAEATSARKLIDHLDQAILSKAFRGELVPQDPTDQPASILLEGIGAERQSRGNSAARRSRRLPLAL